jgi:2-aminobenzoate-CoA ligase
VRSASAPAPTLMTYTAHVDGFARDSLPPRQSWPELIFELPELQFPERLNCASELLDKAVAERGWGNRPAIRSERGDLTYRQLLETANRIARVLVEDTGLIPGNRVLLRGGNTPLLAACWFAVQKAGAIAVTTMPLLRRHELTDIVARAEISVAICDAALTAELFAILPTCPSLRQILTFHDADNDTGLESRMATKSSLFSNVDTAAEDIALIAFTSGTTGKPKGAMHTHRDVMAICACFPRSTLRAQADDIFCGTPPFAFTYGLGGLLLFPVSSGGCVVLIDKPAPETLLGLIEKYRATICFSGPTFYRMMAPLIERFNLGSLRQCVSAGEALPVATRRLWRGKSGIDIVDGIGSTEMLHIFISAAGNDIREGATGKVVPGYCAAVFDERGNPVPPGHVGRLGVKGPTGCRYLADARQTDYVQNGWNFTGDAYLMDTDGYFFYQARTDDMIISAGYNISGPEVEDALLRHQAVAECAVVGVADEARGQLVKACVVLRSGYAPGAALVSELQEFAKHSIAPYKYPRLIEFRDSLPRTETGKLQRFKLRTAEAAVIDG